MTDKRIIHNLSVTQSGGAIIVRPGNTYEFVLAVPTVSVSILEAEDALFRNDSAVFLPTRIPDAELAEERGTEEKDESLEKALKTSGLSVLEAVFRYHKMCVDNGVEKRLLITGHTDSVGSDSANEKLSLARAKTIKALIIGSIPYETEDAPDMEFGGSDTRDEFVAQVMEKNTPRDQQQILEWISGIFGWDDVNPQGVDGAIGQKTKKAIKAFKTRFADQFPVAERYAPKGVAFPEDLEAVKTGFKSGDVFGKNSWAATFEILQAELQMLLKETGGEMDLVPLRKALRWADEKMAVGCGEVWPIEERGTDNYRSQTNRRVEILFYDPKPFEKIGGLPCKDEQKCAKGDCQLFRELDRYAPEDEPDKPNLRWEYIDLNALKYADLSLRVVGWGEGVYCDIDGPTHRIGITDDDGVTLFKRCL